MYLSKIRMIQLHHLKQKMESLVQHEMRLVAELKDIRKNLKKAIESSPEYQKVLASTLSQPLSDGSNISLKLAKSHAFKVVKSMLTATNGDETDADE